VVKPPGSDDPFLAPRRGAGCDRRSKSGRFDPAPWPGRNGNNDDLSGGFTTG